MARAWAQEELLMPNLPLAATAIASVLLSLVTGSFAQTVPQFPLAVICFNKQTQTWAVGYLNVVNKDGSATYSSGDLSITVNAKGLVQPPSDRPAGGDCFGKTLNELRAAGRVMEFKRSEPGACWRGDKVFSEGAAIPARKRTKHALRASGCQTELKLNGEPHEPFTTIPSNFHPFCGARRSGSPGPIRRCVRSGCERTQL